MREAELHAELKFGGLSNQDENLNFSQDNFKKQQNFKPLIERYTHLLSEAQQSFIQDLNGIQMEISHSRELIVTL